MMPTLFFPFLLLSAIFAQQGQSLVKRGSFLTPTTNSSWPSPSGLYAFGFYKQGNGFAVGIFLAGLPQKTVVWTANPDKPLVPADSKLNFTSDGKLVLQSAQGEETSLASTFPKGGITSVSMLDTGNFVVLYSANQQQWQSFDYPTDTFLPTQNLSHGKALFSSVSDTNKSTGKFQVLMQEDGWLAMYPVGTQNTIDDGYWGEGTGGQKNDVFLHLKNNGHLYLINGGGFIIWNMTDGYPTTDVVYRLTIDPDGILRLYSHDMNQNLPTVEWFAPKDVCKPRGLCGDNGYCVLNSDQKVGCECLPQFEPVNKEDRSSGCQRNSTVESCKSSKGNFTMKPVPNTLWAHNNYGLNSPTQANCEEACLQDCNCEAALFKDGSCTKHTLPLRFVRKNQTDSTVALIKVGTSTPTINTNPPKEPKKEHRSDHILIISVSLLAFVLVVSAISGIAIYRYRVSSYKMANNRNIVLNEDFAPKSFTYAELEKVTDGFKEELGRGAFGIVFKGAILNIEQQINVAVKRLDRFMLAEREREFQTEMKVIGRIHHKNLVRLLGYCDEGSNRLLVYEYMSNGSLADVLFTPIKPSWDERIEIACHIARGILYLHEECEPQIVHCDIKPQNILMDENRLPKISDFGLSKLLKVDQSSKAFTDIRGTRGYVAPEWFQNLPVTVKVDVYSFGIVLLEIICCRKSVDHNLPEEEAILEQWACQCFEAGELGKLVNNEEVDKTQLERMAKVGLWCIMNEPSRRPSMKNVLLMLEGTVDIPVLPSPTSSFLSTM